MVNMVAFIGMPVDGGAHRRTYGLV